MNVLIQLVLLVLGFVMLVKGADWFVEGASKIADRFGIPQLVIGLTIVAMGTSAPEAAVSISAAIRGSAGITIGNILGSNILNVLIILGLTSVIRTITVQKSTIFYELPFVILVSVILAALGLINNQISRIEGVVLWALMILYLLYLLYMSKHGQSVSEDVPEADKNDTFFKMLATLVIGLILIVWGSDVTVDAATELARIFGMSERLIGLTIIALGTSLPELVTSVTAAIKGKSDIAVGNIVGSNIFNILFVVGTTALITPVAYSADFLIDTIVATAAVLMLLLFVFPKKRLSRPAGIIMLLAYAGYFAYLIR